MHEMSINVQNVVKKYASAGFQRRGNFRFDRPDGLLPSIAWRIPPRFLLDIANRSREKEVVNGISTMEKATDGLNRTNHAISVFRGNHQRFWATAPTTHREKLLKSSTTWRSKPTFWR